MTLTTRMDGKATSANQLIYSDIESRKVLQFFLRSPRTLISPEILATDEIGYPQLKSIVTFSAAETENLLSRMAEAKLLVADLADKVPGCPECGTPQLSTRYLCPKCFNYDIARSYLYEHLRCGRIASDDTFKKGDQLVCPKCQTALHNYGVEYRAVGAWYKCNNCDESFNAPTHSHICRPKRHQFTADRARLVPIYQYRLNLDALGEIRREVLVYSDAVIMLEDAGLTALAPQELLGKSGQPQLFDIVATVKGRWSGTKTIAIDVVIAEPAVSPEAVRAFATKVKDVKPSESYLITVPGLTDEARNLAKKLKLAFIEGGSLKEATTTLLSTGTFKDLGK